MSIVHAVGINYRSAPLSIREKIAITANTVADHLKQLKNHFAVREAAILSTCNRTEIYCLSDCDVCRDKKDILCTEQISCNSNIPEQIASWFGTAANNQNASPYLYHYRADLAVKHLFRVTSGLDSELIGEPEITGQVKQFAELARKTGASGTVINRLMEHALKAAAEIRHTTGIGAHSLSYPGLAAKAAANIFSDLRDTAVLFVGVGDMARAGLPIFRDRHVRRLAVTSRTLVKAEALADQFDNCEAFPIVLLHDKISEFDIIITATASQVPIIGKGAVESALRQRKHKPIMFADLAIPCDLEPEIKDIPDVFVYNLNQFGDMVEKNKENRHLAVEQAQPIIDFHTENFHKWLRKHAAANDIRHFRDTADGLREHETQRALRQLARGDSPEAVVQQIAKRLTAKLIHLPTKQLSQKK